LLKNKYGERFMPRYDERAELAPRDIVSRSIVAEMRRTGTRTVYLDMTALDQSFLRERFPKIYSTCLAFGLDIAKDLIPVSPASHYFMGGIRTDLWGRSTLAGLYAAGEVSCTGVHGANRLASNSLLEGLVFGARAGEAAAKDCSEFRVQSSGLSEDETLKDESKSELATAVRKRVKRVMWERVGIIRDRASLQRASDEFDQIAGGRLSNSSRNFVTLAKLVATAALWREESRGGHYRSDFPEARDNWRVHSVQQKEGSISAASKINFDAARAV
jgi:L-aspartate oxidase